LTNPTTTATDGTAKPTRRRGVFHLHEEILGPLIDLPDGQRIIGFRPDPLRMSIDVCVEGDGLPECPPGTEPYVVNAESYTARFSRWATRGRDLEEMLLELVKGLPADSEAAVAIRRILDGTLDPRVRYSTVAIVAEPS
jgi:hypothetical protein